MVTHHQHHRTADSRQGMAAERGRGRGKEARDRRGGKGKERVACLPPHAHARIRMRMRDDMLFVSIATCTYALH